VDPAGNCREAKAVELLERTVLMVAAADPGTVVEAIPRDVKIVASVKKNAQKNVPVGAV